MSEVGLEGCAKCEQALACPQPLSPADTERDPRMPNIARRTIALAALAVAIIAAVVALDLPSVQAQSDDEQAGRIVARRLDDGRTEFGWQPTGGERVLPHLRYFPAGVEHNRWLNSSPIEVDGVEIGRINVRLADDGRLEFAFTPPDGERIEPQARYFPAGARVGRWLRSTKITISAAPATGFVAVSAGGHYTCAIRTSGEIECWGYDYYGQRDAPDGRYAAISAATDHACAIRTSGEIACWGRNQHGQSVAPPGLYTTVSAGRRHTCAIRTSGEIACWGDNDEGQSDAPAGRFAAIAVGGSRTCAIRESGAIECWGYKEGGDSDAPAGRFTTVSAAWGHACAIRDTGEIECWGDSEIWDYVDDAGTVRGHETGLFDAPVGSFTSISSAVAYACAIRDTGTIACWGLNGYPTTDDAGEWQISETGQTDSPTGSFRAVSTGQTHSCGLRDTGEIECWGDNWVGQATPPN